jgi:hypothetical protein
MGSDAAAGASTQDDVSKPQRRAGIKEYLKARFTCTEIQILAVPPITSLPGRGCQPSPIAVSVGIRDRARSSSNYRTDCVRRKTISPTLVTRRAALWIFVKN